MASSPIDGYISSIETAVQGRDVRGAIVASIRQCYNDVSAGQTWINDANAALSNAARAANAADEAANEWTKSQADVAGYIDSINLTASRIEGVVSDAQTATRAANDAATAWTKTDGYKHKIEEALDDASEARSAAQTVLNNWNNNYLSAINNATNAANTAATRAEAVADMQGDISQALSEIQDATDAANTATGQLEDALESVPNLIKTAQDANTTAGKAYNNAVDAKNAADAAYDRADQMYDQAEVANTTAGNALTAAQQALRDANTAIETANSAASNAGAQADEAERWAGLAETATNQANLVAAEYDNIINAISSANTQAGRAETQAGLAETAAGRANTAADSIQSGMTDIANLKTEYSNQLAALAEAINSANEAASDASASAEDASDRAREANDAANDARELMNDLSGAATAANNAATAAQTATSEAQAEIDRLSGMIDEVSTNSIAAHDNAEAAAAATIESRTAKSEADTARDAANTAANRADAAAEAIENLEVSSESVASNIDAEATVYEVEGNKHIHFKLKQGEPGAAFVIKGDAYATLSDLEADVVDPMVGDQYNVGSGVPYNVYRWTGTKWEDQGPIGVQNESITKPDIDTIFSGLEIESAARKYLNGTSLDYMIKQKLKPSIDQKVNAVTGKGLSTNDFTTAYKNKVDSNAQQIAALSSGKVDAVEGYGLSQVNFSTTYRDMLVSASNTVATKLDANKIRDSLDITEKGYVLDASRGKELYDAISAKLDANKVVNDLTTSATDKALSAAQGVVLKAAVDAKLDANRIVDDLTTSSSTSVLSAKQGVVLKTAVDAKLDANRIADDLTTNLSTSVLSAKQGVVLAGRISAITPSTIGAIPATADGSDYRTTGGILVKNEIDYEASTETQLTTTIVGSKDKDGVMRQRIFGAKNSDGSTNLYSYVRGTNVNANNYFGVGLSEAGNPTYIVKDPAAFRSAINISAMFTRALNVTSAGQALDARAGKDLSDAIALKIDTSKIVDNLSTTTKGFVLDASRGKELSDAIAGAVMKTGSTSTSKLTGGLIWNTNHNFGTNPSGSAFSAFVATQEDSSGNTVSSLFTVHNISGTRYFMMRAVDGSSSTSIGAGFDSDGNSAYYVSDASAFRKAIGFSSDADVLPLARGGTAVSLTSAPSMLINVASDSADTVFKASPRPGITGILPLKHGGTGQNLSSAPSVLVNLASTTPTSIFAASPRPGVTGTLGISNGGTGATSMATARANLGFCHYAISGGSSKEFTFANGAKALLIIGGNAVATHSAIIVTCSDGGAITYTSIVQGSRVTLTSENNKLTVAVTSGVNVLVIPFDGQSTTSW